MNYYSNKRGVGIEVSRGRAAFRSVKPGQAPTYEQVMCPPSRFGSILCWPLNRPILYDSRNIAPWVGGGFVPILAIPFKFLPSKTPLWKGTRWVTCISNTSGKSYLTFLLGSTWFVTRTRFYHTERKDEVSSLELTYLKAELNPIIRFWDYYDYRDRSIPHYIPFSNSTNKDPDCASPFLD